MNAQDFTDKQLIEKYLWMRQLVDVKKKALVELTKPYIAGMEVIEKAILARLIQRQSDNTKTDAGTAYKSEIMNVKIEDRDVFLNFVTEHWEEWGNAMLIIAAPQKDAVREYVDKHQAPPPGVSISYYTNVNVRKA